MATMSSVRSKIVGATVGAAAAGAMTLFLAAPASDYTTPCVSGCSQDSLPTTPTTPTTVAPTTTAGITTTTAASAVEGKTLEAQPPAVLPAQVS
ncbi:MAG: hypothetical protein JWL70_2168, partial [Acidimicrobiia bacterium]|nr:hypothetical protein [Acidimicrobiia bacterium]